MSKEAMKLALEALEKVSTRTVIMGSTGDYREGQLDALSAVSNDVATAIFAIKEALAEQPAQQEPVAYGMWDTMLGKDNRMMMVRLDKGQDGCTVPLFATPQAQQEPVGYVEFEGDDVIWTGDPPESGTVLYATP